MVLGKVLSLSTMDSILSLHPLLPNPFTPPSSLFHPNRRITIIQSKSSTSPPHRSPIPKLPFSHPKSPENQNHQQPPLLAFARHVALAALCLGLSFSHFRSPALAAVSSELSYESEGYAAVTKRLLETAAVLVRRVEEEGSDVKAVEDAWRDVRRKKEELQGEILEGLQVELRRLRRSKESMVRRCDEIVEEVVEVRREIENVSSPGEVKERVARLEEEYGEVWESVGEIEDQISRRETLALSYGVRELCFIQRECQQLVQGFTRRMRRKASGDRYLHCQVSNVCVNYRSENDLG